MFKLSIMLKLVDKSQPLHCIRGRYMGIMFCVCSVPVGLLMHGLERGLVSQEKRDGIRKEKYELRRHREQQW